MNKGSKRIITLFTACLLAGLPVSAALHNAPPAYGEIVMTVEEHFNRADIQGNGVIHPGEYIAISAALKNQPAAEARLDFEAMDMNSDGVLDLDEFYGEMPSDLTL